MRRSIVFCFPVFCLLMAGALSVPSAANAQIGTFPTIRAIPAQLTLTPPPAPVPAPPAAAVPRPKPPAARPARQALAPARPPVNLAPAPNPPAVTAALDQSRNANELLQKQVGDLTKQVSDLSAQAGDLRSQISSLNGTVSQLQRQMADAEGSLKDAVEKTATQPLQQLELSGAIEKGVSANIDRIFQSLWSNMAVLGAFLVLLGVLLGSMIIGLPVKALMYRVPAPRVDSIL